MITIEELKEELDKIGYYATEELLYEIHNALCVLYLKEKSNGQDIFAKCLEGPPGAGKTFFAKTYTKLASKLVNKPVVFVDYQCDNTTGKNELYEDVNMVAAVMQDGTKVNIPGKVVKAIEKVNNGEYVVLFIDEYDKAREETDSFFNQFLQDGKINTTQHGDLSIKEEYKSNLQVFFCMNDMRDELTGALSRRLRISRLESMHPDTFYTLAKRTLIEERKTPIDEALLNLVSLMYQKAYDNEESYTRLPAASEMLIALEDADRKMRYANAPQHIVYSTIINNMFKSVDDIETFEASIGNNDNLKNIIDEMKKGKTETKGIDINTLIAENVFNDETQHLIQKSNDMQTLIEEYNKKMADMQALIEEYNKKIADFQLLEQKLQQENSVDIIQKDTKKEILTLENGKLISTNNMPMTIKNFSNDKPNIRRGENIFDISNGDWTNIGSFNTTIISHKLLIDTFIKYADSLNVIIFENGVLFRQEDNQYLIFIAEADQNNNLVYKMFSNNIIIPSTFLNDIKNLFIFVRQLATINEITESENGDFKINALVYNDTKLTFDQVQDNVYNISIDSKLHDLSSLTDLIFRSSCSDINNAVITSNNIVKGRQKVIK